jgi:hypothetical protein
VITVGNEQFRAGEILFSPSFLGFEQAGVHEVVFSAAMLCDVSVRPQLLSNIVLCGGLAALSGLRERLSNEVGVLRWIAFCTLACLTRAALTHTHTHTHTRTHRLLTSRRRPSESR